MRHCASPRRSRAPGAKALSERAVAGWVGSGRERSLTAPSFLPPPPARTSAPCRGRRRLPSLSPAQRAQRAQQAQQGRRVWAQGVGAPSASAIPLPAMAPCLAPWPPSARGMPHPARAGSKLSACPAACPSCQHRGPSQACARCAPCAAPHLHGHKGPLAGAQHRLLVLSLRVLLRQRGRRVEPHPLRARGGRGQGDAWR